MLPLNQVRLQHDLEDNIRTGNLKVIANYRGAFVVCVNVVREVIETNRESMIFLKSSNNIERVNVYCI